MNIEMHGQQNIKISKTVIFLMNQCSNAETIYLELKYV